MEQGKGAGSRTRSLFSTIAMAQMYEHRPETALRHRELIDDARQRLAKYGLTRVQMDEAAVALANAIAMAVDDNDGKEIDPDTERELECGVLEWCRVPLLSTETNKPKRS